MAKRSKQKKTKRKKRSKRPTRSATEWVGGQLLSPFFVSEGDPFRPQLTLWLELPADVIVWHALADPSEAPIPFAETLRAAMRSPAIGPPRTPARVRVADARLAAELHVALPELEVVVAPTPELHAVLAAFAEADDPKSHAPPSYLEAGRVAPEAMAELFVAADLLYRLAPWSRAGSDELLRLDVPALGVEGACVSLIGALGESVGVVIFPSLVAFERFFERFEQRHDSGPLRGAIDLGTTVLSLDYERGADVPASMRKEIAAHGWSVAGPAGYPLVTHRDVDGVPRPLQARDVAIVTACARALTRFFVEHSEQLRSGEIATLCESYALDGLAVRLCMPYQAGAAGSPPLVVEQHASGHDARDRPAAIHDVDRRLSDAMMAFALQSFGEVWMRCCDDFYDHERAADLFVPWSLHHFTVEGQSIAQRYLEAQRRKLSSTERKWLEAQQSAWLSVWEVIDVEPGRSLALRDLLTEQERTVREVAASRSLRKRDAILGRVVDYQGAALLCGIHPRSLAPAPAAEVLRRIRGHLRRKRAVPAERLRDEKVGRYIIARWEETVDELDLQRSQQPPPRLQNTDGHEMLITVDHFDVEPARAVQVKAALVRLDGVESPQPGDADQDYLFTRRGRDEQVTLIGRATFKSGRLMLETNSVERADALRALLEQSCGDALRHRAREHSDPMAMFGDMIDGAASPAAPNAHGDVPAELADRVVLEMKAKIYASWPDEPLPALDGQTARQAARSKAGRQRVDLLLKQFENLEAHEPPQTRFDFSGLRRELGLDA